MAIPLNVPGDPGPRIKALVDQLQAMAHDRDRRFSDSAIHDTALGGLIRIVAELEKSVDSLKGESEDAKTKTTFEDLNFRSAGG